MEHLNLKQRLNKIEIFELLCDQSLNSLLEHATYHELKKDEILFKEGDHDEQLYLLLSGSMKAQKIAHHKAVFLRLIRPDELMGLTSLFEERPKRSATLVANEDSTLLAIPNQVFKDLLNPQTKHHHDKIHLSLLSYFAKKVRKKNHELADSKPTEEALNTKVAVFDNKEYFENILKEQNKKDAYQFSLSFFNSKLSPETVSLAQGHPVVCVFVNDTLNKEVVMKLKEGGTSLIALMCAGYNNVDLKACEEAKIKVVRVPAYSPHAVAEHGVALLMTLNRKLHRSYNRVKEGNFSLVGLVGFDLYAKTVGVIGTGKIGQCFIDIMLGFGCKVLAYDPYPNELYAKKENVKYVSDLNELFEQSHIISLHAPLTKETFHIIDHKAIERMKEGVVIINTSRGKLIDTKALIEGLKSKKILGAGLDVYEEEEHFFFSDHSEAPINDDILARLMSLNNVIISSHQAFLTKEALGNIVGVTLESIDRFVHNQLQEDDATVVQF